MNLETVADVSVFDLVGAAVSACHKDLVVDLVGTDANHEDWDRLKFDGILNTQATLFEHNELLVFSTDDDKSVLLLLVDFVVYSLHACDEVLVTESLAVHDVRSLEELHVAVDKLVLLLLVLEGQQSR